MTDQKPNAGDPTESADSASGSPESDEITVEQTADASGAAAAGEAAEAGAAEGAEAESGPAGVEEEPPPVDADPTEGDSGAEGTDDGSADTAAAPAGAAWTTTPVAPDPEATEAALAALAAKPDVTLEPPETPPPPPPGLGGEPPDEGTPVLLVGGILVGAFVVALAIVLILFRPFDSATDVEPTLSPSPVATEVPSASPTAIPIVDTPNFQGSSLDEAELLAEDYGLFVRANPFETDEFDEGTVLNQEPAPGEAVEPGTTIELAVAVPVPTQPVPDVVGLTTDDAIDAIEDDGFVVGDIFEQSSDAYAADIVIRTSPTVASELPPGSSIDLIVSMGPLRVAVPDLTDLPEPEALTALQAVGLLPGDRSEANDESIVAGNVISSDPLAADEVAPGSEVSYVVSMGPLRVAVPDLTDLPEPEALTALQAVGLLPGDRSEANDESIVAGNVISSDPLAADEVAPGSEVSYVVSMGPLRVAVPDLTDLPEPEALTALQAVGLLPGDRSEANDESIVAGNVISSDPLAADEVAPGSEVSYVVSMGPLRVAVPDLTDLPEPEALTALQAVGLLPGDRSEANDESIVAGNVISSDPLAADEVAPGSEVSYVVSMGPLRVAVPDLTDLPEPEALTALQAVGLLPGDRSEANDESIVAGNVISSDPLAADEVAPGSEVSYVVSMGPLRVAVPDLTDLPEPEALTALQAVGLLPGDRSEANDESIVAGNVISSDPLAADEVAPGSEVSYVVSMGPLRVAVPDLTDLPEPEALTALQAVGLLPGDRSEANDESIVAGNVISSDPLAADEVAPGSEVSYVVSLGIEQVEVPDLSGAATDAEDTLAAAGLSGSSSEAFSDTIAAGDVISQVPAAGSSVDIGSTVSYVVSLGIEQVEVPEVKDLPAADAITALEAAGLVVGQTEERTNATIAAGSAVRTEPAAGTTLDKGSSVVLVISKGPRQVDVPDIVGLPEAEALAALESADLTTGDRGEAFSDTIAVGDVISQDPAAGVTLDAGSTVSYVVSLGIEQVEVPDLSGAATDAEDTLAAAALSGSSSEAFSDTIAAGDVISQVPAAGSSVDIGSTVSYVVSLGIEQVEVPEVKDFPAADAITALEAAGLVVGQTEERTNATIAAGSAVRTEPAAGTTLDKGSSVVLVISKGPRQVDVPDIVGLPEAEALAALESADLTTGDRGEAFSDTIAVGDVISQDPAAGVTLDAGSTVSYVVSLGIEQVEVPDLSGAATDAEDTLAAAALSGSSSEAFSDTIAAGDVISQVPAAGSSVDIGSTVSYVVSLGIEQVEVPEVKDLPAADAITALEAAGLVVGQTEERTNATIAAGSAVRTEPAAGTTLDKGSSVVLVISKGPRQVDVPDIVGLPEAEALAALESADLTTGDRGEAFSDTIAVGDVISQDPAAGVTLDAGSTVSYVVSLGIEQVEVPDLSGAATDAEDTLAAAGLSGSSSEAFSDTIAAGDVISQVPAAGSSVDIGSTVSYVVSLGIEQVEVPEVKDLPAADAITALEAAGLVVGQTEERTNATIAAGSAVRTEPAAGTTLDKGSSVVLVISKGPRQVDVPDIVGLPEAEALAALESADLTTGDRGEAFSDTIAVGDVISQDPAAGVTLDAGSTVSYVVSLGIEQVEVPDLSGAATDAEDTLAAAALSGSSSEAFSDTIAAGDVISQVPAAGSSVDIGSTVSYVVSLGIEQVEVPEVKDLPAADAITALEAAGLVVGQTEERTNATIAAGSAVRTEPAAGTTLDKGSSVVLVISKGPRQVDVPDIVGLPEAEALAALESADLTTGDRGEAFSDTIAVGDVISQDPAAGVTLDAGSTVSYVVSLGIEQVEVPDLSGAATDAEDTLAAAALSGSSSEAFSDTIAAGDVISQVPAAGSSVDIGSTVSYVISLGVRPDVIVPAVRDLPEADAIASIEAADLLVGEKVEQAHEKVAAGDAIKTDPPADAEIPLGSQVTLYVSTGSSTRTIPEVRDQPAAEAQAALEAEGLVVSTQEKTNAQVAAGAAVKTDPAAGQQVPAGSEVLLTISKGPKPVVVPDITGSLQQDAKAAITAAKLTVGQSSTVQDDAPKNTVLSQDPAADAEVPQGTAVDYILSSGPALLTIPEVRDQPAAEAQAALEAEGLVVSTQEKTNAQVAAGAAVKTDPAAGQQVPAGSEVLLTISKGPKPVVVPDITGSLQQDAKAAITAAKLTVGQSSTVQDDAPKNTVLSQDPAADAEVPQGTAVDYILSSGPALLTIPEVRDQPAAEAQAALEAEGLVVSTQEKTNAQVAAGAAVKTDPAAGQQVPAGSEVLLTISKGPKPVVVPDITGSLQQDAKAAITAAKLTVGQSSTVQDDAPKNTVLSQEPVADAEVPQGTAVDYILSSGPALVTIPEVRDQPAAEAQAALEAEGLVVSTQEKTNAQVAAGAAVKTDPAAGQQVPAGSEVLLTISKGPKQETVPDITGLAEPEALAELEAANLSPGVRTEAIDETVPKGSVIDQNPDDGTVVDRGTDIDYVVSLGPPIPSRGAGGSLENQTVIAQLDAVAATVPDIRELELGGTPYDGASGAEQASLLAERVDILREPSTIPHEENALKRMGLLGGNDDLASLLEQLYGQSLPIGYLEQRGRQSVLRSIDKLNVPSRAEAAREFGRAAVLQAFGADAARVSDLTAGDEARAALALELGDGTATMLDWAAQNVNSGNQSKVDGVIVPGSDGVYESMPPLLQREYSFPYLEGRLFVDRLREAGGWDAVDSAWTALPESTEQIMHPKLYRSDRPTTIDMSSIAGRLGGGWKERWQQSMGELRIGVWLADGQPGTQQGPKAPIKLPKANAAAGWGGDRLVSLDGPDGTWAIVWQTKWDTSNDIGQFTNAASAAIADLPGAHAVLEADVSGGVSNPSLVLLTSDADTLTTVGDALGVAVEVPAS